MATPQRTIVLDWAGGGFPAADIPYFPHRLTVGEQGWEAALMENLLPFFAIKPYTPTDMEMVPQDEISGKVMFDVGTAYEIPYLLVDSFIL